MTRKPYEHAEQVAVIDWCLSNLGRYPDLDLIFAVPNGAMLGGAKLGAIRMNYLKAEGLRPGVPDLVLPVPCGKYHGMFIEMKSDDKGRPSENQKEFIARVERLGYYAIVGHGADDAIEQIEWYMNQKG